MTALSTAEKAKVRYYLGYPGVESMHTLNAYSYPASSYWGIVLERNMNDVLDSDTYTLIQAIITKLTNLETSITNAQANLAVDSIGKGDVVLNKDNLKMLWKEHYIWCSKLAQQFYVPIKHHPCQPSQVGHIGIG